MDAESSDQGEAACDGQILGYILMNLTDYKWRRKEICAMSDMFSGDITNADNLQIRKIFGSKFMKREFHEAVVKRAIDSRNKVSKETQRSFKSVINSTVKVQQFPNESSKAPRPYLVEPVLKNVTRSDKLAGAVLKVWAESHDVLGDVVVKHLGDLAMPVEYPDFSEHRFRGSWFSDAWTRERDKILERHGEFDKDDVALMLCYVSGKIPGSVEKKDDVLSQGLEYLRSLPPNAAEWEEVVPEFVKSMNAILKKKEGQRSQAVELDAIITDMRDAFSAELAFFERDADLWSVAQLSSDADISEALQLTTDLQSLLTEYQFVYEIAPVFSEEQIRRQKREKLEPRLLRIMDRIDRLMGGNHRPDDDSPIGTEVGEAEEQLSTGERRDERPPEAPDGDVKSEIENERAFSEADYSALKSEHKKEIDLLQSQLHKRQNEIEKWQKEAERWRKYYIEEASKGTATAGEDEDLSIESVNNAVELAKERFGNKLLFQLNGKSRVKDNPFRHPKAVWDALQWLATTYYEARMGKNSLTNFNMSIRKACKWWYKHTRQQ